MKSDINLEKLREAQKRGETIQLWIPAGWNSKGQWIDMHPAELDGSLPHDQYRIKPKEEK